MKFGFVTCVQLGLSCMEAIYEIGGQLDLAITLNNNQAVNKSGRIYLDSFCEKHNIPLVKSRHINDQAIADAIREKGIDWLFVIGWSQIAGADLLAIPTKGVLGIHPTLLPEGRGRASIPWAILKGLDKTGVTMFKLDSGVDTGPIVEQIEIPLTAADDAGILYRKVNKAHIELVKKAFPLLQMNELAMREQDESLASEWGGRTPEDGKIDISGSVHDAEKLIRATTRPYPGAYLEFSDGKRIIWKASTNISGSKPVIEFYDGKLELVECEDVV